MAVLKSAASGGDPGEAGRNRSKEDTGFHTIKPERAQSEDAEAVYRLICELEGAGLPRSEFDRVYQSNLKNSDVLYLVCRLGGSVVAFGSLHTQLLLHHCGPAAEIQELAVLPGLRGNSIGSALFAALKEEARQRGCVLLEVCCNVRRLRAHRFYEKCGMERSHFKFTLKI